MKNEEIKLKHAPEIKFKLKIKILNFLIGVYGLYLNYNKKNYGIGELECVTFTKKNNSGKF